MTKTQKLITILLSGFLLLSLTIMQEEWFVQNNAGIWLYRICSIVSILLTGGAAGRILGKKAMWFSFLFIFLIECSFGLLFQLATNGKALPASIHDFLGYIYLFHCRDYIVYDHDRGQYDKDLFYTLKPGNFNYSNMEFSTNYQVNLAGFRDDESSLIFPEIIFLGDSYTMGWGVEQDENYVNILEKKLNKKILNLGIASYGTAREYLAFERMQRDSCQLVILQFCPNDTRENRAFVENNFQLKISPKTSFEKEVTWNKIYQLYFPLKYIHAGCHFFLKKILTKITVKKTDMEQKKEGISEEAVKDFFKIINKIKEGFSGEIIIFNLGMNITSPHINEQFSTWIKKENLKDIYIFPSTDYLTKDDYLPLDTHLTKSGNKKLANGLARFIQEKSLIRIRPDQ